MYPFITKQIRHNIELYLEKYPSLKKFEDNQSGTINDIINDFLEFIEDRSSEATSTMTKYAGEELSIAYFGCILIGYIIMNTDDNLLHPISSTWLNPENDVDPNKALQGLLINIANNCVAIIELATLGFGWQARVLLRSTLELTWLTIVLTSNREKMILYCQPLEFEEERKLFHKHFSASNLQKDLSTLEQSLGLPPEALAELTQNRAEAFSLYSQHVHNSYFAVIFGTHMTSLDDPGWVNYSLFGTASVQAKNILSSLNSQVFFYLLSILPVVLKERHKIPKENAWKNIFSLRNCFILAFLHYLKTKNVEDNSKS